MAGTAGAHRRGDVVGPRPAGDEGLGTVHNVSVAFAHRPRQQIGDIGTAAGLGHAEDGNLVAGEHGRNVSPLLLLRPQGQDGGNGDGARPQARGKADGPAAHDLLRVGHLVKDVPGRTAVLLGVAESDEARVSGLPVKLAGERPRFLPMVDMGLDLPLHEFADARPQQFVGFSEILVVHGSVSFAGSLHYGYPGPGRRHI